PEHGGIAVFIGTVRSSAAAEGHDGDDVIELDYEAHRELADERLEAICAKAGDRWDVRSAVAIHRIGTCALGEPTVVIACGAPHRKDALEACRWIIDTVKSSVPIFKREVYEDGTAWVSPEAT
ncbi:MAG: molybdenum cofactor biosynthesis protein MoaE, partial [Actinobacteria bacterium]|nr:molybdenum cofactor biosynthesis protein MoaE [Actinomycetota bacterium]